LFDAPQKADVLAVYDELSPWRRVPKQRAYFVCENISQIRSGKKPHFVTLANTNGLSAVPLYDASLLSVFALSSYTVYAIAFTNRVRFTIARNEGCQGDFELPVYRSPSANFKRILLTPITLAVDISLIGGAVFVASAAAIADPGEDHRK